MRALQLFLVLVLIGPITPGLMPAHGTMASAAAAVAASPSHAAEEGVRCCGAGTRQADCDPAVALLPPADAIGARLPAALRVLRAAPRYRSPVPDGLFRPPTPPAA